MDSTRAPVPSDQKRLGAHNRIASQRPPRLAALQALAFCLVVTTLIVVPPAQLSPANLLEGRLAGPPDTEAQAVPAPSTKPDVWAGGFPEAGHKQSGVRRPGTAFSRYVKTTNRAKLSRLGCAEGRRLRGTIDSEGSIVVLDFGRPTQKGRGRGTNGALLCSAEGSTQSRRSSKRARRMPRACGAVWMGRTRRHI